MANISGMKDKAAASVTKARAKRPFLDHLIRAYSRYQGDTGDRLAAAVTYFGFLSFFPLIALAFSVLGFVVANNPDVRQSVTDGLSSAFPGLIGGPKGIDIDSIANAKAGAGILGIVGLLLAGLGWVDALREAIRSIWHQNVKAGNFITKKLSDILILAGLGLTLVISLAVSSAATTVTGKLLSAIGLEGSAVAGLLVKVLALAVGVFTDVLLFLYLFIRLPKLQTPWRKVVKGALFAAVGFELLKIVGTYFIARTTKNPVYGTFAVVVGLLVWINLVTRFLLFSAAWTVTAPYDSDVAPSGTADAEQAEKAGIPTEYADNDPDDPALLQEDGAPTPLVAALQGETPAQDQPEGRPGEQQPGSATADRRPGQPAASAGQPAASAGQPGEGQLHLAAEGAPTDSADRGAAGGGGGKAAAVGAGAAVGAAGIALLGRRGRKADDEEAAEPGGDG
jgi:membrane protein